MVFSLKCITAFTTMEKMQVRIPLYTKLIGLMLLPNITASSVPSTVDFMFIAKYIERIGDHATNIAEWAIFVETGIHPNLNDAAAPAMPAGEEKVLDKGPDEDI